MNLSVEQVEGSLPVTVLRLSGDLDASNYQALIDRVHKLYGAGTRDLLLDLSELSFMSSAGIVALHACALILRGQRPPDPEAGWEAFHALDRDLDTGLQRHIKLLSPQPRVDRALEKTGLKTFFEIYPDQEAAIASFG
jgi:anti-anti-sigma regulatory factor